MIERAIGEQLLARLRKAGDQLVGAIDAQPQVLVVGGADQAGDDDVVAFGNGAADELVFEARLAFEVENLLLAIAHVDQRFARVVLGDQLARLRRHAEAQHARPGFVHA